MQGRETYREHLVGLVQDEHLHCVGLQEAALDHIVDTTRGTDDNLGPLAEGLHVLADAGAANARMAFDVHEVSDGDDDLLDLLCQFTRWGQDEGLALLDGRIDLLEDRDGERGRLAGSRLSLGNDIVA